MPPILTGFKMVFGAASEPTYTITPSTTSVNEGSSVIFTINTYNVPDGTLLYWTTNTVSGTVNTSDFGDSSISGSFVINGGVATVTRTLTNDITTEGTESFQLQIRTGSTGGPIVATSATVTINDTSITPSFSATGGTVTTYNGFTIHTFTSSGTFTVNSSSKNVHILMVAGGGSGAPGNGGFGGGGGGGVIYIPSATPNSNMETGSYSITVGSGAPGSSGSLGGDTTITTGTALGPLTAKGGGASGTSSGTSGGCGGGADGDGGSAGPGTRPSQPGKSGTYGFGFPGGSSGGGSNYRGAGGGGAGGTGENGGGNVNGYGGAGKPNTDFGPWCPPSIGTVSAGGQGGIRYSLGSRGSGTYGYGGGGGYEAPFVYGDPGGNGIVVIGYN